MPTYCALTVRKLTPGTYDQWREAWWPESQSDDMPEGGEVLIVRNLKDPDEIIAFGLFEGDLDEMRASMGSEEDEQKRHEAMAPYIESIGADGMYEVIERIGAKAGATR
jgi:hypothetical protein